MSPAHGPQGISSPPSFGSPAKHHDGSGHRGTPEARRDRKEPYVCEPPGDGMLREVELP